MNFLNRRSLVTLVLCPVLASPVPMAAQDNRDQHHKPHRYKLIDVGTFGGPTSSLILDSRVLNTHGSLVGWADTPAPDPYPNFCFHAGDCFVSHAFHWQDDNMTDLGVLPGGGSSEAVWIASHQLIVGNSQNGETDPLMPGFPEARGVLWDNGRIIDLGTFGGNESKAFAVNGLGQVAGAALDTTPDPYSLLDLLFYGSSNGTQARAFLWQNGEKQDLGTLGTGNDALAFFVNEAGQVAGFAYTNAIPNSTTGLPTFHPFLWEKGKGMRDLGSFGGTAVINLNGLNQRGQVVGSLTLPGDATWHPFLWDGERLIDLGTLGGDMSYGNWVNDAGEVAGQSALPGDQIFHGFLWKNGRMLDLGLLPGDSFSDTSNVNSKGQVVGLSGNSISSRAVLWEKGHIFDLNTLVPAGSGVTLTWALYINDRGEISGYGTLPNGDTHAVLLIPCDEDHPNVEGCDYTMVDARAAVPQISLAVRNASSRTLPPSLVSRYRFPGPAFGPRN
jgi:probable HAF family extracellular repeat protein